MISHQFALHSVQLPKTNIENVKAKPLMQDRSAIAKNEFENYKINTERANENKNKKQNKTKQKQIQANSTLSSQKGLYKGFIKTLNSVLGLLWDI